MSFQKLTEGSLAPLVIGGVIGAGMSLRAHPEEKRETKDVRIIESALVVGSLGLLALSKPKLAGSLMTVTGLFAMNQGSNRQDEMRGRAQLSSGLVTACLGLSMIVAGDSPASTSLSQFVIGLSATSLGGGLFDLLERKLGEDA
jgi:hypothetical protein